MDAVWADMGKAIMRQCCRWSASNKRAQGPASAQMPTHDNGGAVTRYSAVFKLADAQSRA